jgi:uncharacterized phage protein gp47/JayE
VANDVYNYIDNTGVIMTDSEVIQTEVQQEYLNTFGSDLNLDPSTPQGMLITIETLSRIAVADNNAALANQINPNLSGGVFLDALLQLTGAQRESSSSSLVNCTITGVASTFIPQGAQISTTDGLTVFQLVSNTVIPPSGTIENVQFQSSEKGQIIANANTLTIIVSDILGWETVNNPNDATIGSLTQNDAQARLQRQNTLGAQGNSIATNVISNLYLIGGVSPSGVTFQENVSSTNQTINEILMVPHSLYTCVGGSATSLDIANSIQNSKAAGCSYNNGLGIPISQVVTVPLSNQEITVLFDRPSIVTIEIIVTVHANTTVQDVTTAVQNAIISYSLGELEGQPGFAVGQAVSPFQIAAAISSQITGLFIQEIEVAILSFTQQGTLTSGMNTVTNLTYNDPVGDFVGIQTGMLVSDGNVNIPSGTTVSSLVGSNEITISANATGSDTEILTFTMTPSFQSIEIPIGVWQQAVTFTSLITVNQV